MLALQEGQRVGEIWVLAVNDEGTTVAGKLDKAIAKSTGENRTRLFQRAVVDVGDADILREGFADAAGAADAAVENTDIDLGIAEAKLVQDRGTKSMSVSQNQLARVAELVARAESGRHVREERAADGGKILMRITP